MRSRRTFAAGEEVTRPEVLGVDDVADALHPLQALQGLQEHPPGRGLAWGGEEEGGI